MEDEAELDQDSNTEKSCSLDSEIDPVLKDLNIKLSKSLSYLVVRKYDSSLISGKMLLIIYNFLKNWPKSGHDHFRPLI